MKKIYLAGPDVFARDAYGVADHHKALAAAHGFIPLYPLDNDVSLNDPEASSKIFTANVSKIHQADIVVANLNPFRGQEPDSGTVWEVGYAVALRKPVIAYMSNTADSLIDRIKKSGSYKIEGPDVFDDNYMRVEDFKMPLNLMLAHSVTHLVEGSLNDALTYLKQLQ